MLTTDSSINMHCGYAAGSSEVVRWQRHDASWRFGHVAFTFAPARGKGCRRQMQQRPSALLQRFRRGWGGDKAAFSKKELVQMGPLQVHIHCHNIELQKRPRLIAHAKFRLLTTANLSRWAHCRLANYVVHRHHIERQKRPRMTEHNTLFAC